MTNCHVVARYKIALFEENNKCIVFNVMYSYLSLENHEIMVLLRYMRYFSAYREEYKLIRLFTLHLIIKVCV